VRPWGSHETLYIFENRDGDIAGCHGFERFSCARADDPAYYKLEDVKELTIYKEGENELRPTFSFETVAFQQINPGWGKRTSSFGEFGRHWMELAVTPGIQGSLGLGGYGNLFARLSGV
jgi:hypothetical protein